MCGVVAVVELVTVFLCSRLVCVVVLVLMLVLMLCPVCAAHRVHWIGFGWIILEHLGHHSEWNCMLDGNFMVELVIIHLCLVRMV